MPVSGCAPSAEERGRAPSTVSRELRGNVGGQGRYLPATAERRGVVIDLLGKRGSPEQVADGLAVRFPDQPERHLCIESIYQVIYHPGTEVTRPAKRRRRRRRRRVQGLDRRGRRTAMTMVADRPAEVEDRIQIGHGEPGNRSAIGTLVERVTRFVILIPVATGWPTATAMAG